MKIEWLSLQILPHAFCFSCSCKKFLWKIRQTIALANTPALCLTLFFFFFTKYDTFNTYLGLKGTLVVESSAMLSHNSWFLHNLWRVCWTPQSAHNGSGTSHVLQKCVAFDFMSPWRQGSQNTSFLSWPSLKLKQLVFYNQS